MLKGEHALLPVQLPLPPEDGAAPMHTLETQRQRRKFTHHHTRNKGLESMGHDSAVTPEELNIAPARRCGSVAILPRKDQVDWQTFFRLWKRAVKAGILSDHSPAKSVFPALLYRLPDALSVLFPIVFVEVRCLNVGG
jgi:hypothetical protein